MKINAKLRWALVVAGLTALVFLPVLQGTFLRWDDCSLYVENPYYRGLDLSHWRWMCSTFLLGHWQPLTWLSCALDSTIWGMNPLGWHLTHLLIHALNAVLVYLLCLAFLSERKGRYVVAALAALFWAVHPLRVEAVAWLATRGYLLCTTFCLLTVLFYVQAGGTRPPGALEPAWRSRPAFYLAALLCFTLATFTKGIGMMLPLVLLLIDGFFLRRMGSVRTAIRCTAEKIPFFALSLVTGVTAFLAKRADGGMAPVEVYSPIQRVGQAMYGVWFYLSKTVSPQNLSPLYEKHPEAGLVLLSMVLLAGASISLFLFRRRLFPIIGTFGAFLILIFPMLGITQSGSQMFAERFTYLAAIPLSVLVAAGLVRLKPMRRTVLGALAALLLIFGGQSAVYSKVWQNGLSLWSYAVDAAGRLARVQNNLGTVYLEINDYEKAGVCFEKALAISPESEDALSNRALIRVHRGDYQGAVRDLNAALTQRLIRVNDRSKMRVLRGLALEGLGDRKAALGDYSAVIETQGVAPLFHLKALQARARLQLVDGQVEAAKMDLEAMLVLPDLSGEFHGRARFALEALSRVPEK
jgi:tetratricopeptide (TPR) repeat protein